MTEAARLEQSLSDTERVRFDVVPVVAGCVEGFRLVYPAARISLAVPNEAATVEGAPDLVAQMLDKLLANAVEFAAGGAIDVVLAIGDGTARLSVANDGPPLPQGTAGRLFESMVSVRKGAGADERGEPHLGLGLYIVRAIAQFHGGTARAADKPGGTGVAITVTLPLA